VLSSTATIQQRFSKREIAAGDYWLLDRPRGDRGGHGPRRPGRTNAPEVTFFHPKLAPAWSSTRSIPEHRDPNLFRSAPASRSECRRSLRSPASWSSVGHSSTEMIISAVHAGSGAHLHRSDVDVGVSERRPDLADHCGPVFVIARKQPDVRLRDQVHVEPVQDHDVRLTMPRSCPQRSPRTPSCQPSGE